MWHLQGWRQPRTLETHGNRWVITSPVRNAFGETDEAISVGIGRLAMTSAQAMGAGKKAWFDAN